MPEVKRSHLLFYNICFACCFVFLALVLVELGSAAVLRFRAPKPASGLDRTASSIYRGKPWAEQYWYEDGAAGKVTYQSYVVWKQSPYAGQQVNVDADFHRKTLNSDCSGHPYTVWMFGGSTIWGTGSPDEATIPSQFAALTARPDAPVCVVNFGQTGWRNTQEVIELMLALKRTQQRPNLVIFYDGFNDGYSFYQSGKIDVHMNYDQVRAQLERPSQQSLARSLLTFLLSTHTGRLITGVRPQNSFIDGGSVSPYTNEADAKADLQVSYFANLNIVKDLAAQYGFEYTCFWQPTLFAGHKPLSPEEEKVRQYFSSRIEETDVEYRQMSNLLKAGAPPHFFDISNVFDGTRDTVFVDFVHVGPEGNKLVAARIYSLLQQAGWRSKSAKKAPASADN